MATPSGKKTITFDFYWFWGSIAGVLAALCVGFWTFHRSQMNDQRSTFDLIQRDTARSQAVEVAALKRDFENRLQSVQAQNLAHIQIQKLESDSAIREKDAHHALQLEALRAELAAARSTVQLHADSGYISVKDLVVDSGAARKLMASGTVMNLRRLILPDYSKHGWTWYPDFSLAQVTALLQKQELPLKPDDVKIEDPAWWPIVNMYAKTSPDFEAYVGTFDFEVDNINQTLSVVLGQNPLLKEITKLPIGMIGITYAMGFMLDPQNKDSRLAVKEFSAKSDAFYITTSTSLNGKEYENEFLVTREGKSVICAFAGVWSKNAADPIRKETSDWTKRVRIIAE